MSHVRMINWLDLNRSINVRFIFDARIFWSSCAVTIPDLQITRRYDCRRKSVVTYHHTVISYVGPPPIHRYLYIQLQLQNTCVHRACSNKIVIKGVMIYQLVDMSAYFLISHRRHAPENYIINSRDCCRICYWTPWSFYGDCMCKSFGCIITSNIIIIIIIVICLSLLYGVLFTSRKCLDFVRVHRISAM